MEGLTSLSEKLYTMEAGNVMRSTIFARTPKSPSLKKPILRSTQPRMMMATKHPAFVKTAAICKIHSLSSGVKKDDCFRNRLIYGGEGGI